MKKRFLLCFLLVLVMFLTFVAIRENSKKYNLLKEKEFKNINFIK